MGSWGTSLKVTWIRNYNEKIHGTWDPEWMKTFDSETMAQTVRSSKDGMFAHLSDGSILLNHNMCPRTENEHMSSDASGKRGPSKHKTPKSVHFDASKSQFRYDEKHHHVFGKYTAAKGFITQIFTQGHECFDIKVCSRPSETGKHTCYADGSGCQYAPCSGLLALTGQDTVVQKMTVLTAEKISKGHSLDAFTLRKDESEHTKGHGCPKKLYKASVEEMKTLMKLVELQNKV